MLMSRRAAIAVGVATTACLAKPDLLAQSRVVPAPADLLEIRALLMRFAWAIDTTSEADAVAAFSRDAVIYDFNGNVWKRANGGAIAFVQDRLSAKERGVQHHVQINRLERIGSRWHAESYWSQVGWRTGSPRPEILALGAFVDRIVQQDGKWLITEKRISLWNSQTVRVAPVKEPA